MLTCSLYLFAVSFFSLSDSRKVFRNLSNTSIRPPNSSSLVINNQPITISTQPIQLIPLHSLLYSHPSLISHHLIYPPPRPFQLVSEPVHQTLHLQPRLRLPAQLVPRLIQLALLLQHESDEVVLRQPPKPIRVKLGRAVGGGWGGRPDGRPPRRAGRPGGRSGGRQGGGWGGWQLREGKVTVRSCGGDGQVGARVERGGGEGELVASLLVVARA